MSACRILIVEDDPGVAIDIRDRLERLGHQTVGIAASAQEAMALAAGSEPALALVDIRLKGEQDGIAVATQIHQDCRLPVVFLTADAEDALLDRARSAEPFGYVVEPFAERELRAIVETALDKHRAGEEIQRLYRMRILQSQVSQAIVRIKSRNELFEAICRIAVERGGFKLAWVGSLERETMRVIPVARTGDDQNYLDNLVIYADDRPEGRGLTGTAIRSGAAYVSNDFLHDERLRAWHGLAAAKGFRAGAAVPLRAGGVICGALMLYAAEKGFFHEAEVDMIEEVARDVSFALDKFEEEAQRRKAEQALAESENLWHATFDAMNDAMCLVDMEGRIRRCNRAMSALAGVTPGELSGRFCYSVVHGTTHPIPDCPIVRMARSRRRERLVLQVGARWLDVTVDPFFDEQGNLVGGVQVLSDVTERKRAEAERDRLFNLSLDMLCVAGFDGFFKQVNPAWGRALGWTDEYLLGRPWLDFVHPEDQAATVAAAGQLSAGQPVLGFENRYRCQDGSYRWISWNSFPLVNEKLIFAVARDVTILKEAQEKLRRSRQEWHNIFEAIGHPTLVLDPEHTIVAANRAAVKASGMLRKDMVGKKCYEVFHGPQCQGAPAGCPLEILLTSARIETVEMEMEALDGIYLVSCTPVFGEGGRLEKIIHIATEITERKRAEQALRGSEASLEAAQRIAHLGSWEIELLSLDHLAGSPVRWSDETYRIFGYEPGEDRPVGELFALALPGEERVRVWREIERSIRDRRPYDIEHRILRADGSERVVHAHAEASVDEATGQVRRLIGTVQDITDRKRLETQLRQVQKMESIGALAGGVAHDFNNMITVILGNAHLIVDPHLSEDAKELLSQIIGAAERASTLTRQLLTFGRRQPMRQEKLDLNEVVRSFIKMLGRIIGEDIELRCEHASDLPPILADVGMLEQVMMNLAVNARDAMPSGGQLRIRTGCHQIGVDYVQRQPAAREGEFVCLQIEDTGCGIPADNLPRIFEPFFSTKGEGKGTGLGLATTYGIVRQHEGWIEVDSLPGKGTVFRVFLPISVSEAERIAAPPPPPTQESGHEGLLVVEDDTSLRELVVTCLQRAGYRVVAASNGEEALAAWERHKDRIDLVITDIIMPGGMTGFALVDKLKETRPGLKVIYSSGYSVSIPANVQLEEGVNYLPKPFGPGKLSQAIRKCLEKE